MKSPSYSASFNLKGKKTARLSCRCCTLLNLKEHFRKISDKKEMRNAMKFSIS